MSDYEPTNASHKNATWRQIWEAERECRESLPPLSQEVPHVVSWLAPSFVAMENHEREEIIKFVSALANGKPVIKGWDTRHQPDDTFIFDSNILLTFDGTADEEVPTIRLKPKRIDQHYREPGDPNTLVDAVLHYKLCPDDHLAYSDDIYRLGKCVEMPAIRFVCVETRSDAHKLPDSEWTVHREDRNCWSRLVDGLQRLHSGELTAREARKTFELIEGGKAKEKNADS